MAATQLAIVAGAVEVVALAELSTHNLFWILNLISLIVFSVFSVLIATYRPREATADATFAHPSPRADQAVVVPRLAFLVERVESIPLLHLLSTLGFQCNGRLASTLTFAMRTDEPFSALADSTDQISMAVTLKLEILETH